jgi:hypothetical protein
MRLPACDRSKTGNNTSTGASDRLKDQEAASFLAAFRLGILCV